MAEMTTPILFMKQLMYKLSNTYQDDSNKLNLALADLTNISGKTQITDWTQLRDMIKADITTNLNNGGTAKDFLKNYCNIDLDNEDCGALIGYDCSGGEILTNDNIINEEGNLQTHPATATIRGCTISFPTYSDSTYNYVMDGLYTWWIGLPFNLVKESFGLEFNSDSFVNSMPVDLYNNPPSGGLVTGAYVSTWYNSDNIATALSLNINMNDAAYGTIIIGDKSGNTTDGWFAALDRILAHELTHAVMSTNIRGFNAWLPSWFNEGGTAELVNGCDDSRTSALLAAAVNTSIIDDGFSSSPTMAREYSVGFIAMRYLLKKYTDRQQKIIFPVKPKEPFEKVWEKMAHGIRSEHCVSRDGDLNKIMDEFVDFCQRDDYNLVQPWTLCANTGSKTLRIPLEGHEHKVEDEICVFYEKEPSDPSIHIDTYSVWGNCVYISNIVDQYVTQGQSSSGWFPGIKGTTEMSCGINDINEAIDYFNNDVTKSSIIIILESCSVNGLTKNDYDRLLEAVDVAGRVDEQGREGKLVIIQLNRVSHALYDSLNTMSDDDFRAYFNQEYSYEEQEMIQYLFDNGAWVFDVREREWDRYNSLRLRYNSYNSTNIGFAYGWNITRRERSNLKIASNSEGDVGIITGLGVLDEDHWSNYFDTWHNILIDIIVAAMSAGIDRELPAEPMFKVEQKKDIDFPCFYLSTGVFKPSTWNGQGLNYPSSAVSNANDEYIPFNIHVLNDYRMRFDLQGVGTCKKVTGKEGDADILNSTRSSGEGYEADVISDVLPGIGCPLIARSVENKSAYNTILCYFTKTDYSGTFTLIFYDEHDEEKPPVFQSVAFGLGITEEESYKYPLYTAGGTSGLIPQWYSKSWTSSGGVSHTINIYGNGFNFDMDKGDTLDSLLYPVATTRCGISNFRVLQPDGRWKSVINWRQVFYKGGSNTCGAYITKNNGNNVKDYLVYPTISDTTSVDRYVLVQPITVIKKHIDGEDESGFLMSINGVKCKPDRLRSMFSALDGHEYLIVPNGWYDRTLGLPLINSVSITEIMDLLQKMPKQTYVLCVDLG